MVGDGRCIQAKWLEKDNQCSYGNCHVDENMSTGEM
jgi:hypothetical protein